MLEGARILVAPLDWGLGHAARCVPVFRRLMELGAVPIIGADGAPLALLANEFPELERVRLPGVVVRYSKGHSQRLAMARQFPAMIRGVRAEKELLGRLRHRLRLDAVISDQRFGLHAHRLPSVLVTHQVFPVAPFAQAALRKLNLRHIARFDACWIMDEAEAPGLAGELAHGPSIPANARYIGTLSRLRKDAPPPAKPHRIVAVISGPEPQRTLLEGLLAEQLQRVPGEHLLVRGRPSDGGREQRGNLTLVPHLPADGLAAELAAAELVVSRSGYTTLMDLTALGRKALIIPTPGQPEQEYLAALHAGTGRFLVQLQDAIDLHAALERAGGHAQYPAKRGASSLDAALAALAGMLRSRSEPAHGADRG